jgi:hypothetical protein
MRASVVLTAALLGGAARLTAIKKLEKVASEGKFLPVLSHKNH